MQGLDLKFGFKNKSTPKNDIPETIREIQILAMCYVLQDYCYFFKWSLCPVSGWLIWSCMLYQQSQPGALIINCLKCDNNIVIKQDACLHFRKCMVKYWKVKGHDIFNLLTNCSTTKSYWLLNLDGRYIDVHCFCVSIYVGSFSYYKVEGKFVTCALPSASIGRWKN